MIPPFQRNGLLPEGEHLCEWPEFALRFGRTPDNGGRRNLLLGVARILFLLGEAGCRIAFVDGSFVTRERWPKDFDVCYEEDGVDFEALPAVLNDISLGRAAQKAAFGGEALPAKFPFDFSGQTVREAFTRTRTHEKKGLVRLELETAQTQIIAWLEEVEGGTDATNTG